MYNKWRQHRVMSLFCLLLHDMYIRRGEARCFSFVYVMATCCRWNNSLIMYAHFIVHIRLIFISYFKYFVSSFLSAPFSYLFSLAGITIKEACTNLQSSLYIISCWLLSSAWWAKSWFKLFHLTDLTPSTFVADGFFF